MKQSLIQIANYQYASEAYLFKAKLQSEGIEVFLQNENTVNAEPAWSNAIGGVKLFVYSDDVMKAKQVLNSVLKYSLNDDGTVLKCPECGGEKIEMFTTIKDLKSFLAFVYAVFTFSLPFYTKHKYKCESCNFEF
jgi:predicted RNA-binding Zn-ribbon protein involved in translation (DUF1610 family)